MELPKTSYYKNFLNDIGNTSSYSPAYPTDPEASSSYYFPSKRISSTRGTSARSTPMGMDAKSIRTAGTETPKAGGLSGADWGGAATGALGLAGDIYGISQRRFNFGNIASSQTDSNSAPTYTAGEINNQVAGAKPKGASTGDVLGGAGKGAAIGTQIMPGIGTAIGAVAGALFTGIGGLIGKNQQDTEKNRKMAQVQAAQNTYNRQAEDYRMHQNQLYNYYNQNNAEGREYNVLRSRMTT